MAPVRRSRPWHSSVLAAVLVLAITVGTPLAAAYDADFFIPDGPKNALVPDWVIHPASVEDDGKTYVVFQHTDLDPYAAMYDPATRTWEGPVRVGSVTLNTDPHGAPALLIDNDHYLHVFFGSHHGALQHYRSAQPGSIAAWVQQEELAGKFTYPQPILRDDGTIEIFYRGGASSMDWVSRSTDASGTWGPERTFIKGAGSDQWYAHFSRSEAGTSAVNAAFLRMDYAEYDTGALWGRHDIFYMHRAVADGEWTSIESVPTSIPVTPSSAGQLKVYDSGSDNTNSVIVREDAAGDPAILFVTGSGAGPTSYRWTLLHGERGSGFTGPVTITTTDHFYDAGTFGVDPSGTGLEAFLVTGGTKGIGTGDRDYSDDGGELVRFSTSDPHGLTGWARGVTVSPTGEGSVFNAPQLVDKATLGNPRIVFDEWRSGPGVTSLYALGLYLWGDAGLAGRSFPAEVVRLFGKNRAATAVAISRESWPMGSNAVIIATGASFPDALSGGPLAFAERGPLLYATGGVLDDATKAEIRRLRAQDPKTFKAFILGGTNAVLPATEAQLKSLGIAPSSIIRLQGASRYETSAAIVGYMAGRPRKSDTVVLASGADFPDALSVSGLAAHNGWPILLTQPSTVATATTAALEAVAPRRTIVVGGPNAITPDVYKAVQANERWSGPNRYETSRVIAERSLTEGLIPRRVVMASGANYPDALAGGVYAARVRGPVVLTPADVLGDSAAKFLADRPGKVLEVVLLGGTAALGEGVHQRAAQLIQ